MYETRGVTFKEIPKMENSIETFWPAAYTYKMSLRSKLFSMSIN